MTSSKSDAPHMAVLVNAIKSLTNEDQNRHVRRITNRSFVTHLLGSVDSCG